MTAGWSGRGHAPRSALVLPVLGLHALLLVGIGSALRPKESAPDPPAAPALVVRRVLLLPAAPAELPKPRAAARRSEGATGRTTPRTAPAPDPPPAAGPGAPAGVAAQAEPAPGPPTTPSHAASDAATADVTPLLDSAASRQALRSAARAPLLSERTAAATEAPQALTTDARLGAEVARSARGDCLKGEYPGGGMGLLSAPFLAAAALMDKCRR